ncbi:hypothetical protein GE107_00190 [Cohnella sp. CFH 77786]|uniref:hypothetical protein n=1 Tax=Cohnella sp. CFH 77786 TaxID=2662265 RepID=UPI001C60A83F|nr:hypothetical protein [Cohnella sp. CFH 77786]MBW5444482.1 hypothetical protein [Cohnella sp. CFH 77786]
MKSAGRVRKYLFEVETAWKGVNSRKMTVYSYAGPSASCGFEFSKNRSYLVYAYQAREMLQTNLCSGNVPVDQADRDIRLLGAGIKFADGNGLNPGTLLETRTPPAVWWGAGSFLLIAVSGWIWRRKKRRMS